MAYFPTETPAPRIPELRHRENCPGRPGLPELANKFEVPPPSTGLWWASLIFRDWRAPLCSWQAQHARYRREAHPPPSSRPAWRIRCKLALWSMLTRRERALSPAVRAQTVNAPTAASAALQ